MASSTRALCGFLVIYWVLCFFFWPFAADDAFIVGRYALNAASGNGLVYNPGEYVTALTSPLHALIEALIAVFWDDPVAAYRLLAAVFPSLAAIVAVRIMLLDQRGTVLFLSFFLASPFLAVWTVGGLETPILAAFVTLFSAILFASAKAGRVCDGRMFALGALAGLAFLTRYDSMLVTFPPMLAIAVISFRRLSMWLAGLVSLGIAASWLVFSWLYYGDVIPTSAFVKLGAESLPADFSLLAVVNFLIVTGLLAVLPLLRPRLSGWSATGKAIGVGSLVAAAAFVAYAAFTAGQHMMFGFRTFVPYLGALGVAVVALRPRFGWVAPALALGANTVAAVYVLGVGLNPAPINQIPGHPTRYPEYFDVTPAQYGRFIASLRDDAADLSAHWQATGNGGTPSIFLYTGGTGYWLPEFHVYETLVSFRETCPHSKLDWAAASNYVQDFEIIAHHRELMGDLSKLRPDLFAPSAALSEDDLWFARHRFRIRYLYGDETRAIATSATVHGPCPEPDGPSSEDASRIAGN